MKQLRSAPKLQRYFWTITSALGILGATQVSFAGAIIGSMYEGFDYADGTLFSNPSTLNGGQGWNLNGSSADLNAAGATWGSANNGGAAAGTFRTATSPGLTYAATGYLTGTGNKLTLDASTPNVNQHVGRSLGGQFIDSGTTYFSLLMSKNNDTIRTINFAFFNGTSERFAVGQISGTGTTAGNIGLLMNNSNPGGLITNANPIAMGVGVTHLIIGEIIWNPGGFETVSIWVDPTDVTTQAAAGLSYLSTSAFELTALTAIRPFVGNTAGSGTIPAVSANFDEIRFGGTWESVTSLAVVPEPSTAALGAVAGLLLCLFRNRK